MFLKVYLMKQKLILTISKPLRFASNRRVHFSVIVLDAALKMRLLSTLDAGMYRILQKRLI